MKKLSFIPVQDNNSHSQSFGDFLEEQEIERVGGKVRLTKGTSYPFILLFKGTGYTSLFFSVEASKLVSEGQEVTPDLMDKFVVKLIDYKAFDANDERESQYKLCLAGEGSADKAVTAFR